MNKVLFSKNSDEWETPIELYNILNEMYSFTLDPCATPFNKKCEKYYTKDQDGLNQPWNNEIVFCNPPYSQIKHWVKKSYEESFFNGATVVLLLPVRTDTKYFHDYILKYAKIYFIKGRLHFNNSKNSAPFPSMIVEFKKKGALYGFNIKNKSIYCVD